MHKMKCQMTAFCETSMQFDRVRILSCLFCESSATRAAAASGGRLVGGGGGARANSRNAYPLTMAWHSTETPILIQTPEGRLRSTSTLWIRRLLHTRLLSYCPPCARTAPERRQGGARAAPGLRAVGVGLSWAGAGAAVNR